jgi:hypothetical protein
LRLFNLFPRAEGFGERCTQSLGLGLIGSSAKLYCRQGLNGDPPILTSGQKPRSHRRRDRGCRYPIGNAHDVEVAEAVGAVTVIVIVNDPASFGNEFLMRPVEFVGV